MMLRFSHPINSAPIYLGQHSARNACVWRLLLVSFFGLFLLAACNPSSPVITPFLPPQVTPTPPFMPCVTLPYSPAIQPELMARSQETMYFLGPAQAPVTILLFTDFQCVSCAMLADSLRQVLQAHPQEVRLGVMYLPVRSHDKSRLAWQAAEAAARQERFWEMYHLLFARQADWYDLSPEAFRAWLEQQLASLNLQTERFWADFEGEELRLRMDALEKAAAGIPNTPPLLFINSALPYNGLIDFRSLDTVVRLALLEARKFHTCPPWMISPNRQYIIRMETNKGEIILQLFPEKAPLAVNNFVFLARAGWYDGIPFHRVDAGFVAQSGDPSGTGYGNPGYYFQTELAPGLQFDRPGQLAMSNIGVDTNGSQFFITLAALPELNRQFTIFGEVIYGLEVVQSLTSGDLIQKVNVEER